jgi:hypothetical protein
LKGGNELQADGTTVDQLVRHRFQPQHLGSLGQDALGVVARTTKASRQRATGTSTGTG